MGVPGLRLHPPFLTSRLRAQERSRRLWQDQRIVLSAYDELYAYTMGGPDSSSSMSSTHRALSRPPRTLLLSAWCSLWSASICGSRRGSRDRRCRRFTCDWGRNNGRGRDSGSRPRAARSRRPMSWRRPKAPNAIGRSTRGAPQYGQPSKKAARRSWHCFASTASHRAASASG
jgi:hypothetical protein